MNKQEEFEIFLNQELDKSKQRVSELVKTHENVSDKQAKKILGNYGVAIGNNFVPWMVHAYANANSKVSKAYLLENLDEEIHGNHPRMLRDFLADAGVVIGMDNYFDVSKPVADMNKLVYGCSFSSNIVATTLENVSPVFIPYIANLAKQLGSKNFTYTDVHGEADIVHAEQAFKGSIQEMMYKKCLCPADKKVASTIDKTTGFLEQILSPVYIAKK
ncbi:MAG: iron-containing redox enzyme family protein [Candidatus Woesearchaeota archaeon]